jgi:dephospho-CoA kinase
MAKIILGLVGQIASGKEVTKKYISEKYGAKDCKFSTSLRDVLNRIEVPISRENLQRLSTILRENFGEDLLAKIIAADASKLDTDVVVIDGVRRMGDIQYLKELPNFYLIAVVADPKVRYDRLIVRNENEGDNKKTFEEFLKDQESEADREIPEVIKIAKKIINNDGLLDGLYHQIDEIMSDLLK